MTAVSKSKAEGSSLLPTRRRTTDDIYDSLRDDILASRIRPGNKLSVPNLAEHFGVSRSPVREAVQKLVQQGLASEEIHRGAVVAQLDPMSVVRLYELREVLEELAAKLAADRASDDELLVLETILEKHERAIIDRDFVGHLQLDMEFHAAIRMAARNEHLMESLERVQDKVAIAMLAADVSWPQHAIQEHRAILSALRSRSPEDAAFAAKAHISRLRKSLISQAESNGGDPPQSIAGSLGASVKSPSAEPIEDTTEGGG